jgi:hypothetical protein
MSNIPNLFVIGAPKSGTTAFVEALKQHSDIFIPREKEPRFFDAHTFYDYKEDYPLKNLDEYLSLYKGSEAQQKKYRVDGSVFNMYSENSIKKILELSPNAKFIIIIRDPLSATKSMFSQRMKYLSPQMREVSDSFDECWRLIEENERANGRGFPKKCRNKFIFRYDLLYSYEKYLPMLSNLIKSNNLFLASYADFIDSPTEFYKNIFSFLSISNKISIDSKIINKSFQVKDTLKTRVLGFLLSKTFKLRRKIGLYGAPLRYVKKMVVGQSIKVQGVSRKSDFKVKGHFNATYRYLASINIKV